ncbi:MAG: response regulator, partial [Lachnospiraceae bacterium]|nr:response regulator [Lachnospiraceae bacterium]
AVETNSSDVEFIADNNGMVVAHSDSGEIGKNYNEQSDSLGAAVMALINSSDEDYYEFYLDNSHYIAYSARIQNDWHCVFVKDATSVFAPLKTIFIGALVAIFVIIALTSLIMIRSGMKQIMSERQSNQLSATADIYVSMHEINFVNDTFTEVRNNKAEASQMIGEVRNNCQQMIRAIMTQFSDETTRESLLDFVDFEKLNERLKDERTVTCEFLSADKKWRRARYIVSDRAADGKVTRAMFLIEDIEAERRERDKMYDTAQKLANQIRSIANIYTSVTDIDLIRDSFSSINVSDNVIENTIGDEVGNCQQVLRGVMTKLTDETSLKAVLEFIDFSNIEKNVAETGTATIEFLNSRGIWCRGRFIVSERTEDGRLSHVLWATENIDEEKRKRDMLTNAAETLNARISSIANIYMTSHDINIVEDSFIEMKSDSKYVNDIVGEARDNAQEVINRVLENAADPSCVEDVLRFVDFSTLDKRMRRTDTITIEFQNREQKWRRGRFIASKRDEKGKLVRVIWLTEDIDDEKRERDELLDASERALAASEAKSSFLSNMSHEIRTPINAVLGMNEMILRECDDNNVLAYSESIKTAGNTLLGLVNDILDFSKIEAGKMEIIPVDYDLSSVVNDLVNMIQTKADDKGLELVLEINSEIPKELHGDEIRIKQVITNILTNAVKYTEKGSVTLSIDSERIADDADSIMLMVSVTDTGIGIKPEDMKKLFSEFDRIEEERNRKVEGTGLGMSITKRLLEMMGSTLEVESVYELGSKFSFRVKQTVVKWDAIGDYEASYKDSLEKHAKYRESFRAPEAQILVVDDTEMNLTVFRSLLKQTGVKIDTAMSGDEGLALSYDRKYDMIFLDHMMPDKDGIETLHELRSRPKDPNLDTPTICLTANAISGAREKYLEAGFDDYLTKPIDCDKLEQMMVRYLPESKVQQTREEIGNGTDQKEDGLPDFLLSIDEINTDTGINNNGGVPAYLDTLKVFAGTAKKYVQDIEKFCDADDIRNATIKIHALKSTARIIGATDLGELAQKLEDAGKAEDRALLTEKLPELLERARKLGEELSVLTREESDTDQNKQEITAEELAEAYARIRGFAEDCDNDGIEKTLEMLAEYVLPDAEKEKVNAINTALEDFDFDGIAELL